jgi:hypothetical protein
MRSGTSPEHCPTTPTSVKKSAMSVKFAVQRAGISLSGIAIENAPDG